MALRACMGGTFDRLHRGHRALLRAAATLPAEYVFVGVTSDELASRGRSRVVRPLAERMEAVERFVRGEGWDHVEVAEITDPVGRAMEANFTHIVVTPETRGRALDISRDRERGGVPPLHVVVVPFVLADDGRPVRATRVAEGEIDEDGRLRRPPVVVVGSDNPAKVDAVRAVFERFWKGTAVKERRVPTRAPEQPRDAAQTWAGALARARAAVAATPGADFGVGIEAGLLRAGPGTLELDVQACAIVDAGGRETVGLGPGFLHAPRVLDEVEAGRTVGEAVGALSGDPDVGRKDGAIGWLTKGALTRRELTESAVIMALVPRLRPELYGL